MLVSHKTTIINFYVEPILREISNVCAFYKVPGKYVSTKNTANDVSQMRHIIHIGQGTGDQNVLFSFYGKTVK